MTESKEVPKEVTPFQFFINGFLIRLIYGFSGIGIIAVIRPNFFAEHHSEILIAMLTYLFVCIAGGIYDLSTRRLSQFTCFKKKEIIYLIIFILLLLLIFFRD
jgi:hypothetical protein